MRPSRLPAAIATVVLAVAAGCSASTEGTSPTTATSTVAASTTTSAPAPTTTGPRPSTTTTSLPATCRGVDVETPAIVALSAADGSLCWSALTDWNAYAAAVADGRLVVFGGPCGEGGGGSTLAVLDAATGDELWRHELAGGAATDGRAVLGTGQGVVMTGGDGAVEGLDLATGSVLWSRPGAALVADGPDTAVVAGVDPSGTATSTTITVLERRTGQERWSAEVEGPFLGGVAADERVVLVGTEESTLVFDALTGAPGTTLPIVAASDTYAVRLAGGAASGVTGTGSSPNEAKGYDPTTGQELWTNPGYPPQRPEPTDGNVYVVIDAGVAALDPRTGEVRWSTEGADLEAGPGLALSWTGSLDAPFEALDPATGAVRWSVRGDEVGLPAPDAVLPSGSTVAFQNVLPSAAGVFFAYGNCLGS